MMSSKKQLQR